MLFSISASSDRKSYIVTNTTTKKTATLVYDFDAGTATVTGDFCLIPIGVGGFPLPTDLPLDQFGQISVIFRRVVRPASTSTSTRSAPPVTQVDDYPFAGTYDEATKTGSLNWHSWLSSRSAGIDIDMVVDGKPAARVRMGVNIKDYPTTAVANLNYPVTTEGLEFAYTFGADGLTAQCEFPGVNPCLTQSMGVKLQSDYGNVPAYIDVPCDENRAYTFTLDAFPTPSQSGWMCSGWFTDNTFHTQALPGRSYTAPTLFAKWIEWNAISVVEHRKAEDGQYHPLHPETNTQVVKTADGGTLHDKLQELSAAVQLLGMSVSLPVSGWSGSGPYTQTVNVSGVTATSFISPVPSPASGQAVATAGVFCSAQAAGSLTFTCTSKPTANIQYNVLVEKEG